jgi:DNA-binding CsgD family transcriptional regulator
MRRRWRVDWPTNAVGFPRPALRAPAAVALTARQREVVELVLAGLSNREIAERFVTSVRTVEGHIYQACQRVGAASRDDLAAMLRAGRSGLGLAGCWLSLVCQVPEVCG